jgi:hypothetical protein
METAGVEPAPSRCKRGAHPHELHPHEMRTGGVEPPQRVATGLQPAELTDAQRPQEGGRPGSNRRRADHDRECLPFTPRPPRNGDDRTRTGGLSPDKRALSALSYAPTPRNEVAPAGVEPASRAHEARGTAVSPRRIEVWLAGVEPAVSGARSRRDVRLPYSQKDAKTDTPGGTRTRASGLRTRRHSRSTTGARSIGGPGLEPGPARYQRAVPPRTPTSEAPAAGVEPAFRD